MQVRSPFKDISTSAKVNGGGAASSNGLLSPLRKFDRTATRKRMWKQMNNALNKENVVQQSLWKKLKTHVKNLQPTPDVSKASPPLQDHAADQKLITELTAEVSAQKEKNSNLVLETTHLKELLAEATETAQAQTVTIEELTTGKEELQEKFQALRMSLELIQSQMAELKRAPAAVVAPAVVVPAVVATAVVATATAPVPVETETKSSAVVLRVVAAREPVVNKRLLGQFKKQLDSIKTGDLDWQVRVKAIQKIGFLMDPEGDDLTAVVGFNKLEKQLKQAIVVQKEDLRSGVVKEVCALIIKMSKVMETDRFDKLVLYFLPHLFESLFIKIKIISSSVDHCIRTLIKNSKNNKLIDVFVEGMHNSHVEIRQACVDYAQLYFESHACSTADEFELLSDVLKVAVSDSDSKTRKAGRSLFKALEKVFVIETADLFELFDSQTQRALTQVESKVKKLKKRASISRR